MARVFDEINTLMDGVRLALKEEEQLDLVNRMSDFYVRYAGYFDSDEFNSLENSLVEAIDFGNQIDYTYEGFMPFYEKALKYFKAFADWYLDNLQKTPVISFVLTVYKGGDAFTRTMKSLFKYRNPEQEIIVLDCAGMGDLKNSIKAFGDSNKVRYYKSMYNHPLINEIDANLKCTGQFVFPIAEGSEIIHERISDVVLMLKNNPQAGMITSPRTGEISVIDTKYLWRIAEPESELLWQIREISHKRHFGYKREFVDLAKEGIAETLLETCKTTEDLYQTIAYQLADIYESLIFGKPLYLNQ